MYLSKKNLVSHAMVTGSCSKRLDAELRKGQLEALQILEHRQVLAVEICSQAILEQISAAVPNDDSAKPDYAFRIVVRAGECRNIAVL